MRIGSHCAAGVWAAAEPVRSTAFRLGQRACTGAPFLGTAGSRTRSGGARPSGSAKMVDQLGSSRLLLCLAREMGRGTKLRARDGERDKTARRCLGASQDSQSKLGGRDEQRLAEGLG